MKLHGLTAVVSFNTLRGRGAKSFRSRPPPLHSSSFARLFSPTSIPPALGGWFSAKEDKPRDKSSRVFYVISQWPMINSSHPCPKLTLKNPGHFFHLLIYFFSLERSFLRSENYPQGYALSLASFAKVFIH